jgi:putative ABC transport system substrate-binding protein
MIRRREFITLLGGAAAAWPVATRAQQPERVRRVGVLMGYSESDPEPHRWIEALMQGLQQQGWIEGRTIGIEYRWATGNVERMRFQAAELVAFKPEVILVASSPALTAIMQATATIPVVFVNVADPLEQGFIENLARPGGTSPGSLLLSRRSPVNGLRS